jgi:hypothetical protein
VAGPRVIFSHKWISEQGVNGTSNLVTVPAGHRYIIKQATFYANPLVETIRGYLRDVDRGATLFACAAPVTLDAGAQPGWFGFYGALVFGEGESFQWEVHAGIGDGADVYAGGYDLVA